MTARNGGLQRINYIMSIFTFHLAKSDLMTAMGALCRAPSVEKVPGLKHAECMTRMKLGAPILSRSRIRFGDLVMFAEWESHAAIDDFLSSTKLGCVFDGGWHVRLGFLRRWGHVSEFDRFPSQAVEQDPELPVVAVTLARMKLSQVPRFVRWGKPVETFVGDHLGSTFALAAMRLPCTVSTFSVWRSQREMLEMVGGHGGDYGDNRHAAAMAERRRKDFHVQFTTLRFRALAEYGQWEGRTDIVPFHGGE